MLTNDLLLVTPFRGARGRGAIFHDHPEGSLLCPTISATQQLLTENFRQAARYLRVGAVVFGFHHDGCLYYCAASDEGENYPVRAGWRKGVRGPQAR